MTHRLGRGGPIAEALRAITLGAPAGSQSGAALTDSQFVVLAADANLASERVLVGGAGLTLTDGGAGGNATLAVGAGDGISVAADSVAVDGTVVRTTRTLTAGAGLTGGGTLAADRTFAVGAGVGIAVNADDVAVDLTYAFNWSGNQTWAGTAQFNSTAAFTSIASHLIPTSTDTYDLGSSTKWWRKGYLSELDAVLFAQNTISTIGGWLLVSKGEGVLATDLGNAVGDTTAQLGTTANLTAHATTGDIIVFRAAGAVEYMKVTASLGGGSYTVTRDLDGSGRNTWPAGSVFVNLGYGGTGRIELNASDTPRISILKQGTTYSAQTEVVRVGDLNGWGDYVAENYGIALGEYAASKPNLTWDATNGLRLRIQNTAVLTFDTSGNADITNKLRMPGSSSAIAIGSTPPTSASAGTGIWLDRTGLYGLLSNVVQAKMDAATGAITSGAGAVVLDASGIGITVGSGADDIKSYRLVESGGSIVGQFLAVFASGTHTATLRANNVAAHDATLNLQALAPSGKTATVTISASEAGTVTTTSISLVDSGTTSVVITASTTSMSADARVLRGLYVGSDTAPSDNDITYDGVLKSAKNSTTYTGYIFVPLTTLLTSTSYDGNDTVTTGTTTIDTSAVFSAPVGIKAALVRVQATWAAAAAASTLSLRKVGDAATVYGAIRAHNTNAQEMTIIAICDSNGDFDLVVANANATNVTMTILGYFI